VGVGIGIGITRHFGDMLAGSNWQIALEEDSILHETYRMILLKREL
jgi:hypothetical protein